MSIIGQKKIEQKTIQVKDSEGRVFEERLESLFKLVQDGKVEGTGDDRADKASNIIDDM